LGVTGGIKIKIRGKAWSKRRKVFKTTFPVGLNRQLDRF